MSTKQSEEIDRIVEEAFDNVSSLIPEWRDQSEPRKWVKHFIKAVCEKVNLETIAQCRAGTEQQICDLKDRLAAASPATESEFEYHKTPSGTVGFRKPDPASNQSADRGEPWSPNELAEIFYGGFVNPDPEAGFQRLANAINAKSQRPTPATDDTKRLDWLLGRVRDRYWHNTQIGILPTREAIDAAMRKDK